MSGAHEGDLLAELRSARSEIAALEVRRTPAPVPTAGSPSTASRQAPASLERSGPVSGLRSSVRWDANAHVGDVQLHARHSGCLDFSGGGSVRGAGLVLCTTTPEGPGPRSQLASPSTIPPRDIAMDTECALGRKGAALAETRAAEVLGKLLNAAREDRENEAREWERERRERRSERTALREQIAELRRRIHEKESEALSMSQRERETGRDCVALQEQVSSLQRQLTHRQLDKDKQEDSGIEAGKILAEAKHILAEAKREAAELETVTANERDKFKHAITMKVAARSEAATIRADAEVMRKTAEAELQDARDKARDLQRKAEEDAEASSAARSEAATMRADAEAMRKTAEAELQDARDKARDLQRKAEEDAEASSAARSEAATMRADAEAMRKTAEAELQDARDKAREAQHHDRPEKNCADKVCSRCQVVADEILSLQTDVIRLEKEHNRTLVNQNEQQREHQQLMFEAAQAHAGEMREMQKEAARSYAEVKGLTQQLYLLQTEMAVLKERERSFLSKSAVNEVQSAQSVYSDFPSASGAPHLSGSEPPVRAQPSPPPRNTGVRSPPCLSPQNASPGSALLFPLSGSKAMTDQTPTPRRLCHTESGTKTPNGIDGASQISTALSSQHVPEATTQSYQYGLWAATSVPNASRELKGDGSAAGSSPGPHDATQLSERASHIAKAAKEWSASPSADSSFALSSTGTPLTTPVKCRGKEDECKGSEQCLLASFGTSPDNHIRPGVCDIDALSSVPMSSQNSLSESRSSNSALRHFVPELCEHAEALPEGFVSPEKSGSKSFSKTVSSAASSTTSSVWAQRCKVGIGLYFQRTPGEDSILRVKSIVKASSAGVCGQVSLLRHARAHPASFPSRPYPAFVFHACMPNLCVFLSPGGCWR